MSKMLSELQFFPDELIYQILVKLPAKSLMRFRCVCKSWKTLTSHPQFVKDHLHTSVSDPNMTHLQLASFIYDDDDSDDIVIYSMRSLFESPSTPTETLTFRMEHKHCFIGSFNGLLCLRDHDDCFRLWNPCTRLESNKSPPPIVTGEMTTSFPHQCYFGYDKANNKYKVLAMMRLKTVDNDVFYPKIVTRLYTFGESYWTTIQSFRYCAICWDRRETFVSGNIHWLAKVGNDDDGKLVIISFDMEKETYGEVLLPPPLYGDVLQNLELHVTNNCLYVCQLSNNTHWVLWLMKEYGVQASWTKFMVMPSICISLPLCILENGVVLLRNLSSHSRLVMYDSNNGTFCHCRIRQSPRELNVGIYHESLVSP